MLPQPHQRTRIGDHSKSAALIEKGRSLMEQCLDCRQGAEELRHRPTPQTSFWLCAVWHCPAETERAFGSPEPGTSP